MSYLVVPLSVEGKVHSAYLTVFKWTEQPCDWISDVKKSGIKVSGI